MIALAMAVAVASLLGSLHCVGMCGPLALWVTSGGSSKATIIAYHVGRLTTYLIAAFAAGLLGAAVSFGGDMVGFQAAAAKVAGTMLVAVGVYRLTQLHPRFARSASSSGPSVVASTLKKARPLLEKRSAVGKAFLGGLITTWLPCGWLYLFVLVAAGTGSIFSSVLVMSAFWIGTIPALTTMLVGIQSLTPKMQSMLPVAASLLLIVTGLYTVTGRAAVDVSSLTSPQIPSELTATSLVDLADQPLPCCQGTESLDSSINVENQLPPCCQAKLEVQSKEALTLNSE